MVAQAVRLRFFDFAAFFSNLCKAAPSRWLEGGALAGYLV